MSKGAKRLERNIRTVIDTNLFISGIFGKNTLTSSLQELWISEKIQLATSKEIMLEVGRVLNYPKIRQRLKCPEATTKQFFRLVFRKAIISHDIYKTDKITSDPTDNKFLACALETKADYVISGDNHLLELKHYHSIQIVNAKTFVKKIAEK